MTTQKPKVVVIDDSPTVLEATRLALEGAGYEVVTQDRAAGSAVPILHEHPALVLVDVNMPGLQGDTFIKTLLRGRMQGETIVLLHSSLDAETLAQKAIDAGAHGYIHKTGDVFGLVREVNRWLGRSLSSGKLPAARSVFAAEDPRASETRLQAAPAARPARRHSGTQRVPATVLFVDDDMGVLSTYRRGLHGGDLRVEFALSGAQALRQMLSDSPPDLVVCDMLLPDITGPEIYQRATAAAPRYKNRFIVATGAQRYPEVADFLTQFTGPVLYKPIAPDELRLAIDSCLIDVRRAVAAR